MKTVLFTTHADKALPLWEPNVDAIYYYNDTQPSKYPKFDAAYFRDPFNDPADPTSLRRLESILEKFFSDNPHCRSIDRFRLLSDFHEEDKWNQYKKFGKEFMPETWLATRHTFRPGKEIIKKRISCRCRDIFFEMPSGVNLEDYIIQKREDIVEEMRVFYLRGKALKVAETRTSKTEDQKVKVIGWRDLKKEEMAFVEAAMKKMPKMEFIGVDLAILKDGRMTIIEINRSPQFMGYFKVTGVNLAEKVFK